MIYSRVFDVSELILLLGLTSTRPRRAFPLAIENISTSPARDPACWPCIYVPLYHEVLVLIGGLVLLRAVSGNVTSSSLSSRFLSVRRQHLFLHLLVLSRVTQQKNLFSSAPPQSPACSECTALLRVQHHIPSLATGKKHDSNLQQTPTIVRGMLSS